VGIGHLERNEIPAAEKAFLESLRLGSRHISEASHSQSQLAVALADLAGAMQKNNDPISAHKIASQALQCAKQIHRESFRCRVLLNIAESVVALPDRSVFDEAISDACGIARNDLAGFPKVESLCAVALTQHLARFFSEAESILEQAHTATLLHIDPLQKIQSLGEIAEAYINRGLSKVAARFLNGFPAVFDGIRIGGSGACRR
jgi:hypothetical protein